MNKPHPNLERLTAIMSYLIDFKKKHDGNTPSTSQIMDACGISSTSMVSYYLDQLVLYGWIRLTGGTSKNRMIELAGGSWTFQPGVTWKKGAEDG